MYECLPYYLYVGLSVLIPARLSVRPSTCLLFVLPQNLPCDIPSRNPQPGRPNAVVFYSGIFFHKRVYLAIFPAYGNVLYMKHYKHDNFPFYFYTVVQHSVHAGCCTIMKNLQLHFLRASSRYRFTASGIGVVYIGVLSPRLLLSSGSTLLSCPAWQVQLSAIIRPVRLSGLQKLGSPFNTTRLRYRWRGHYVITSNHKKISASYVLLSKLCPLGSAYSCDSTQRLIY